MAPLSRRLAIGLAAGLLIGTALGAVSAATWEFESDRARVFVAFVLAGAFIGELIGATLPLMRTRARTAAAGALAVTPVFLSIGMAAPALRPYVGSLVLVGLATGCYLGVRLLPRAHAPERAADYQIVRKPYLPRLGRRRR